ncbi:MAG: hypothetical protein AAB583_00265, partial [Patescibacteria group bacterium]
ATLDPTYSRKKAYFLGFSGGLTGGLGVTAPRFPEPVDGFIAGFGVMIPAFLFPILLFLL